MVSRIALALAIAATSASASAQSNKQTVRELLAPHYAKTNPAVPIAPPEPAQSTLRAQTNDAARGIVILAVYDSKCDTLPKTIMRMAEQASGRFSMQAMKTETDDVLAQYKDMGVGNWCASVKPFIHAMLKTMY